MPFQPVDHAIRSVLTATLFGQTVQNTFWFKYSSAVAGTQELNDAIFATSDFVDEVSVELSDDLEYQSIEVFDEFVEAGQYGGLSIIGRTGGRTIASLPGNVAVAIAIKGATSNRSAQGRSYLGGIPLDKVTNGVVDNNFRTAQVTAYFNLIAGAGARGLIYSIASRIHLGVLRPLGVMTAVIYAQADNFSDSQRRRLLGRGS